MLPPMRLCWHLLFALIYLLHSALLAAEAVDVLPTFTVDSARIPQADLKAPFAVSRIEAERLQTASTQLSLDESLQTVPGVFVLNPYNFAQDSRIAIRGFGARASFGIRGIQLIVDGIPATTPDGQGSVDGLDLGSAHSMEILRGPASALYGAASGGVILIETEDGADTPFLETRWTFGDYGLRQAQFKAGGQTGAFNYLISATDLKYDGYRGHNETENQRVNAKFRYDFTASASLTAVVNVVDLPLQNDPGGLTLEEVRADRAQARRRNIDFDGGESVQQQQYGLIYRQALDDFHAIELKTYYTHRDFANKLPFESGGQVAFERNFLGAGALYRFSGDRLEFAAGLDYDLQDDDRENYDNLSGARGPLSLLQQEQIESFGLFVSSRWALHERLSASASLRQDWLEFEVDDSFFADGDDSGSRRFEESSPMLGLSWELTRGLALFVNAATSFETPTSTELANPIGGGFNADLKSQTATNFEVGLKGARFIHERSLRYELTAFHIDIDDALVPFEPAISSGRDFFRNAGKSERTGIEAVVQFELFKNLQIDLSYTWSDFKYKEFDVSGADFGGNRLPGIPEHFGNLQINYQPEEDGFFVRWNTRFNGSSYANDANTAKVDSYLISDLRIGFERVWGAWTIEPFIGINNVFDQTYNANIRINASRSRYYEPAPERNIYSGIRIRYGFD
jgi:iron complex outermembrane receptor protein